MKNLNKIFLYYHERMTHSYSDSSCILSDIKIICSDGTINYSKLLISLVDPTLLNVIQENEDDDQIVLCPDFQRKEFMDVWHGTFIKGNEESGKVASRSTSKVIQTRQFDDQRTDMIVQSEEDDARKTRAEDNSNEELCFFCGGSFLNKEKLKRHIYNCHHTSGNKFECLECRRTFSTKEYLSKHKTLVHKEVMKQCGLCLKMFKNLAEFKIHERLHRGHPSPPKYKCQFCGKTNSEKYKHERHLLLHNLTKIFNCELCGKSFSLKHNLERHKLLHHRSLHEFCPKCNRTFKRKDNMKRHLLKCKT